MQTPVASPDAQRPVSARIQDALLHVTLNDGRVIATPLDWYPRLQEATHEQQQHITFSISGVHWPDLDEDLSVAGMLAGWRTPAVLIT